MPFGGTTSSRAGSQRVEEDVVFIIGVVPAVPGLPVSPIADVLAFSAALATALAPAAIADLMLLRS